MSAPADPSTWWVADPSLGREPYVRRLLERYRQTPTTCGRVRRQDRDLAEELYRQGVPLTAVEAAFHLAAARRTFRDPRHGPLAPIQSLRYFLPVIREILSEPIDPDYIACLAWKLRHSRPSHELARADAPVRD